MNRLFRFAVQTGPFDNPVALRSFATKVEDLGYAELFSYDHIGAEDPFMPLLVAAEATTTLRFGPLVINNEFHNPVLLARAAATFDALTNGRLVLGMGTGYMQSEHDAADIELRPPGPRVTRFEESLRALRGLLDSGAYRSAGEHIALDVEDLGIQPTQTHVPMLVGGHGKRVVSIAGRQSDIFQYTGLTHDPVTGTPSAGGFTRADIEQRSQWLRDAAGDRYDNIELSTLVQQTVIGEAAPEARLAAADRTGLAVEVIDETPFALLGTKSQVIEKLEQLREELGIHHVVIRDVDDFAPIVEALAGS